MSVRMFLDGQEISIKPDLLGSDEPAHPVTEQELREALLSPYREAFELGLRVGRAPLEGIERSLGRIEAKRDGLNPQAQQLLADIRAILDAATKTDRALGSGG